MHASTAVQIRMSRYVLPHPGMIESRWLIKTLLHSSIAVAIPVFVVLVSAGQSNVTAAGQVISGAMVS
ncbi:MAG TPA: hypothetical protein PLI89_13690, partial [Chitinophagales bacterium]|nr:hypothetical protein [Chitinophagales bacterium]